MKKQSILAVFLSLACLTAISMPASARSGGRVGGGGGFGDDEFNSPSAPSGDARQTRYYCADAKAYYPDVRLCPGGWEPVSVPTPPPK
jgi:hypothetical protein